MNSFSKEVFFLELTTVVIVAEAVVVAVVVIVVDDVDGCDSGIGGVTLCDSSGIFRDDPWIGAV
jgi:hypothetical protein